MKERRFAGFKIKETTKKNTHTTKDVLMRTLECGILPDSVILLAENSFND